MTHFSIPPHARAVGVNRCDVMIQLHSHSFVRLPVGLGNTLDLVLLLDSI